MLYAAVATHDIFFSIILPNPTSTLFPYTTLFRSVDGRGRTARQQDGFGGPHHASADGDRRHVPERAVADRSEEHTSELQSLRHLVCRLLLEKKKKKIFITIILLQIRLCILSH